MILRLEGNLLSAVASYGPIPPMVEPRPATRGWASGRSVIDRHTIHVHDIAAELDEFPDAREHHERWGHRTTMVTPLLRKGVPIGCIGIRRLEVRPFSEQQVRLLETFADQAVIAIENVRLFKELEARTHDLTRSVGELTALSEVGRALSSTLDLETVLQTIVVRANGLAGTAGCSGIILVWVIAGPEAELLPRLVVLPDGRRGRSLEATASHLLGAGTSRGRGKPCPST